MATTNKNYDKLAGGYLFSEIAKRTREFARKNPRVEILRLGVGNTTEPLPKSVIAGLKLGVLNLSTKSAYRGYGDEQGDLRLRVALCRWYKKLGVTLLADEVFISDGAKPDTANIQSIFSTKSVVAVCDPVYPVYIESNVIYGRTGKYKNGRYSGVYYMPCTQENVFFPDLPKKPVDIIYICSPNNPTGAVATRAQLKKFVDWARGHKAVIIFDCAYGAFIKDKSLPKSIYEIPGARECAIEIGSFSKWAGFCGVRLGWTVVPKTVVCQGANRGKINSLWLRRQTTMFNGASNIAQEGGLAVLSARGQRDSQKVVDYYMDNAKIIKNGLLKKGLEVFGGVDAPYIWVKTPNKMSSWDFFDKLLSQAHVVGTPGSGFGPNGEGYFRLSAFGHRADILAAVESIQKNLEI